MIVKNVYVIGVFDLFHVGHVKLLERSKKQGSKLIVAVNGDDMVSKYKRRPIYTENERLELVRACRYVDEAFVIHQFDNKQHLIDHNITIIVHGDDWEEDSYLQQICVTREFLDNYKIELKLIPYTTGVSTSQLIKKIKELN